MSTAWWWDKANSMHAAWSAHVASPPSLPTLKLALAHGDFETTLGDSWPGEHNVGACQERVLNAAEKAALHGAGVAAGLHNVDAAKAALDAAGQRSAGLHCDSTPTPKGPLPYFVFFHVFDSDEAGDAFFLQVVTRSAAERLALSTANVASYASALYAQHYFEGRHAPKDVNPETGETGAQADVREYAAALAGILPRIDAALAGWTPGAVYDGPAEPVPLSVADVQRALVQLGAALDCDGKRGPKTTAAIRAFQAAHELVVDGIVGPKTSAAIVEALAELPPAA